MALWGWLTTAIIYLLGLPMAKTCYTMECLNDPELEFDYEDKADRRAVTITALCWPVVELLNLVLPKEKGQDD